MKTRNSNYITNSMELKIEYDSDETVSTDNDNDSQENEYNNRGLPIRKSALKIYHYNTILDTLNEEVFDEDEDYNKLIKNKNKTNKKYKLFDEEEEKYFSKLSSEKQSQLLDLNEELSSQDKIGTPTLFKVLELDVSKHIKTIIYKKYKDLSSMDNSSSEYYKLKSYIDNILSIPFGKYSDITDTNYQSYLTKCKQEFDSIIYGQENVKIHILEIISQYFTNKECLGNIFGVYGPMGVGKTTIIKEGLSFALKRPFSFISLGGAQDSSFLDGHSYTYEGSTYGKIVECLIKSKCMNPIIYFDELDKISNTPKGDEISNLLIHITDDSQNSKFQDKYFGGLEIDLSRCIFVFSFNNINNVNKILRDRIQLINLNGFNKQEKLKISKKFLIPKTLEQFNLKEINFKDEAIMFLIENYSDEQGVRSLKHIIKKIVSKINLFSLCSDKTINKQKINIKYPLNVSLVFLKKLLELNK